MEKKVVIILGMHRSGTSAIAGALSFLGLDFGQNLLPAGPANEKGFFENLDFLLVHEAILSSLGSSWDSLCPLPPDWRQSSGLEPYKRQIREIILRDFGNKNIFAVKDPRLCRLLPLWQEIIDDLHIVAHYILPVRNPLEVAQSLMKRNRFSLEKGALLWALYNTEAERHTRSHHRMIITYDDLLKCPEQLVASVAEHCNIGDSRRVREALPAIRSFLEPSLRHHLVDTVGRDEQLPGFILTLYRLLRALSERDEAMKPAAGDIAETAEEVARMFSYFYALDLRDELSNVSVLKRELEISQQKLSESLSQCVWTEERCRHIEQTVKLMEGSTSWRVTAPLRFAKTRMSEMFKKAR